MAAPKIPQLRYPIRKINSSDDYLEIKVIKYVPPGINVDISSLQVSTSSQSIKSSIEKPLVYIYLPIPQGINDRSSVDWGSSTLNSLEAFASDKITEALISDNLAQAGMKTGEDIARIINNSATSGVGQDAVVRGIGGMLLRSLGSNATPSQLYSRATGKVLNPHMELLFNGVSLRSFAFQFELAPRDSEEALIVKQIIRTFKKHMAAKSGNESSVGQGAGGVFISSPDIFQLTYKTGGSKHKFLNSFKPMALQEVSVNYTGSGTYATYEDSTPVHMQMTLQFQEINPVYFEDYDDKDIGVGY